MRTSRNARRSEWPAIIGFCAVSLLLMSLYVTLMDAAPFAIGAPLCVTFAIVTIVAFHIEGES